MSPTPSKPRRKSWVGGATPCRHQRQSQLCEGKVAAIKSRPRCRNRASRLVTAASKTFLFCGYHAAKAVRMGGTIVRCPNCQAPLCPGCHECLASADAKPYFEPGSSPWSRWRKTYPDSPT